MGMTEASHQIARNPLPPGRESPVRSGVPGGASVQILDADSTPLPRGQAGEIAIGPQCHYRVWSAAAATTRTRLPMAG